jgi:hypothetical protein
VLHHQQSHAYLDREILRVNLSREGKDILLKKGVQDLIEIRSNLMIQYIIFLQDKHQYHRYSSLEE